MTTQTTSECHCGNNEFFFTKDLNLDAAWKQGNKYCRICTDCGNRYFLAKSMYQRVSDQYVILQGEDNPVPVFDCPACEETVTGQPDECPYCDVEYAWSDESDDESEDDEDEEVSVDDQPDDDERPLKDRLEELSYADLREVATDYDSVPGSGITHAEMVNRLRDAMEADADAEDEPDDEPPEETEPEVEA